MRTSESISELVAALAAAHLKFDPVLKDSTNPHYKSKYADLASVISATADHLSNEGLAVIQFPICEPAAQQAGVTTILAHKSGQFIEESYMLPAIMQGGRFDSQSVGSALTYARRYAYQAAINVAGEDDDGNAATGRGTVEAAQAVATEKLRSHARTNGASEMVTISPYKEGFYALSGPGVSIIRANLDNAARAKFGWVQEGNVHMFIKEHKARMIDLCSQLQISVLDESAGKAAIEENKPTPITTTPFSEDPATDPIILDAKHIQKPGKKPFLAVKWDGHEMSCFDTKLFPFIQAHIGQPAMFDWSSKGQYKNLLHIVRLAGMPFELKPAESFKAQDSDVGF